MLRLAIQTVDKLSLLEVLALLFYLNLFIY